MTINDVKSAQRLAARFLRHCTSLDALIAAVSAHRGRPIRLAVDHHPAPDHPTGSWEGYADHDVIYTRSDASPIQREQAICHEIAHMLLGHGEGAKVTTETLATTLTPDFTPEMLAVRLRTMHRTRYTAVVERDAEALGTMMAAALVARRVGSRGMHRWDRRF